MQNLYPNFFSVTSAPTQPLDRRVLQRRSLIWTSNAQYAGDNTHSSSLHYPPVLSQPIRRRSLSHVILQESRKSYSEDKDSEGSSSGSATPPPPQEFADSKLLNPKQCTETSVPVMRNVFPKSYHQDLNPLNYSPYLNNRTFISQNDRPLSTALSSQNLAAFNRRVIHPPTPQTVIRNTHIGGQRPYGNQTYPYPLIQEPYSWTPIHSGRSFMLNYDPSRQVRMIDRRRTMYLNNHPDVNSAMMMRNWNSSVNPAHSPMALHSQNLPRHCLFAEPNSCHTPSPDSGVASVGSNGKVNSVQRNEGVKRQSRVSIHRRGSWNCKRAQVVTAFEKSLSTMYQRLQAMTNTTKKKDEQLNDLRATIDTLRSTSALRSSHPSCGESEAELDGDMNGSNSDQKHIDTSEKKNGWLFNSFGKAFRRKSLNQCIQTTPTGQHHLDFGHIDIHPVYPNTIVSRYDASPGSTMYFDHPCEQSAVKTVAVPPAMDSPSSVYGIGQPPYFLGSTFKPLSNPSTMRTSEQDHKNGCMESWNTNPCNFECMHANQTRYGIGNPEIPSNLMNSPDTIHQMELVCLRQKLNERELQLTDVQLEALASTHQVDQLRDQINQMQAELEKLRADNYRLSEGKKNDDESPELIREDEVKVQTDPNITFGLGCELDLPRLNIQVPPVNDINDSCKNAIMRIMLPPPSGLERHGKYFNLGILSLDPQHCNWTILEKCVKAVFHNYINMVDPKNILQLAVEPLRGYYLRSTTRESGIIRHFDKEKNGTVDMQSYFKGNLLESERFNLELSTSQPHSNLAVQYFLPTSYWQMCVNLLEHYRCLIFKFNETTNQITPRELLLSVIACAHSSSDSPHIIEVTEENSNEHLKNLLTQSHACKPVYIMIDFSAKRIESLDILEQTGWIGRDTARQGIYILATITGHSVHKPQFLTACREVKWGNRKETVFVNSMDTCCLVDFLGDKEKEINQSTNPQILRRTLLDATIEHMYKTNIQETRLKFLSYFIQWLEHLINRLVQIIDSWEWTIICEQIKTDFTERTSEQWFWKCWSDHILPHIREKIDTRSMDPQLINWMKKTWPWRSTGDWEIKEQILFDSKS